jgi:2-amino-4-hydroxy-6-hydroxymethyldihydropteridine diphosphokinase
LTNNRLQLTIVLMPSETVTTYISLGSNLGDRAGNLLLAVRGLLEAHVCIARLSGVYETEPYGVVSQPSFLNMVVEAHVNNVSPRQLLARMLRIEYLLGRRREYTEKAPRTVDLDLLMFGDLQSKTELLTIPHPSLHLRNFVLVPFAEIAPHVVHPIFQTSIRQLLKNSIDTSRVVRWQPHSTSDFGFKMSDFTTV